LASFLLSETEETGMSGLLTAEQMASWDENGFVLLKGFYDAEREIAPIQQEVRELMGLVRQRMGVTVEGGSEFDEGLAEMARTCREGASLVYDSVKKLPSYIQLATCEKHARVARQVLRSAFVGFAPRGYGIRLDHPGEDKFLTQLHQDYTSQLGSPRGVVFWSPLRRVSREMGPVVLYPGSQRLGIQAIEKVGQGSYGLQIPNADELRRQFRATAPEVEVGDVVIMDYLLLHESSPNVSGHTRWAMISRYFDFTENVGAGYGWKGGLAEGNSFEKAHPELTIWKT
jgi:ectoine hydroxylase-related dioxygenase (phytanoyl-CoA dioxygenase family)